MDDKPPELADYRLVLPWPVQWGDQDAFGHVNNTIYIRWFESARIAYLHEVGLSALMERDRVGPILASIGCNYRRQLKFPDSVVIGARISRIGRSSMTMEHRLVSQSQGALVADGESVIVVFDYNQQKPRRVPDEIRQAIEQFEGRSFAAPT